MFTAQQNIAQTWHREDRHDIGSSSGINRGTLAHEMFTRLKDKSNLQLKHKKQWTSWKIQNELLQIVADLILERVLTETGDSRRSIIMDETMMSKLDITVILARQSKYLCLSYVHEEIRKEVFVGFQCRVLV